MGQRKGHEGEGRVDVKGRGWRKRGHWTGVNPQQPTAQGRTGQGESGHEECGLKDVTCTSRRRI